MEISRSPKMFALNHIASHKKSQLEKDRKFVKSQLRLQEDQAVYHLQVVQVAHQVVQVAQDAPQAVPVVSVEKAIENHKAYSFIKKKL
jgi:hypothetical protein